MIRQNTCFVALGISLAGLSASAAANLGNVSINHREKYLTLPSKLRSTECKTSSYKDSTETFESITEGAWITPVVETDVTCRPLVVDLLSSIQRTSGISRHTSSVDDYAKNDKSNTRQDLDHG